MVYGVGEGDAFGGRVGRKVRFVDVSVHRTRDTETPKWEATTVAEVEVDRREFASTTIRLVELAQGL